MNIGRRIGVAGTVLALTVATIQSASAAPRPAERTPAATGKSISVTLITGDRVFLGDDRTTAAIRPGAGRERIGFSSYTAAGHRYVIPTDALRLVRTGQLDRRLFDVTLLAESGYDDAHRATLPLIVVHDGAAQANVAMAGATVTRDLPSINGSAVNADKTAAAGVWNALTSGSRTSRSTAAGVRKVWLDGVRKSTLDHSVPQIGAPAAWEAGFTGTGVKIAVLDTGVDNTHPDLATREVAEQNFTDSADNVDRFGHGTHVASIAAGTGAQSGGQFKGAAPDASILDGKVLNDGGFGLESWIIAGMEWAVEQGAKVANLSLGGLDTDVVDPLEEAVNTLSAEHGILFVIAAGNSGQPETIGSPGSADAALTVGAVDREDAIADFSSRGPRTGDGAIKPDITAPGVEIVAAKAAEGFIGTPAADGYVSLSGTSMATPHVAGAAALLAQQHPDWTGAQLKATLTASAKPTAGATAFDQGSGRVDVAKAIAQTLTSEPTNVSLGTVAWPHDDDQPVTKPLTYHNTGTADVTLTLAVDAKGPDGNPAPNGLFTLSATQVTVPAGGSAQVSLTGNTQAGNVDGAHSGTIVATAGETSVRTPIAINREVESYNLTLNFKGLDGAPTEFYSVLLVGLDNSRFAFPFDADGSLTVRLPKGRYAVDTIMGLDAEFGRIAFLPHPALTLTGDSTLDVAASAGRPISVTPPDPAATLSVADVGYEVRGVPFGFGSTVVFNDFSQLTVAHLGPPLPREMLSAHVGSQWLTPSGAFYGLAFFQKGTVPTGFTKVVRQRDVARVNARFDAASPVTPDRSGLRGAFASPAGESSGGVAVLTDVSLPGQRTEFYNGGGAAWQSIVLQLSGDEGTFNVEAELDSPVRTYRPGQTYHERFNHGMFGPAFPTTNFLPWALRSGDIIDVFLPLWGDSAGNGGFSLTESANTKLFRNGELVGETPNAGIGFFEVPPEPADYRVTTEATRPDIFDVSTAMSAAWTFRSGHVAEDEVVALPLSAVRFTPELDDTNTAPAGRSFLVPVALQQQSGELGRAHRLSVEVSYDEGKNWQRAQVLFGLAVLLHHPADATSVSLRASASDRQGNTVEQTIIRAYKLARR